MNTNTNTAVEGFFNTFPSTSTSTNGFFELQNAIIISQPNTDDESGYRCNQCDSMVVSMGKIKNVFIHERTCPNENKIYQDGEWIEKEIETEDEWIEDEDEDED